MPPERPGPGQVCKFKGTRLTVIRPRTAAGGSPVVDQEANLNLPTFLTTRNLLVATLKLHSESSLEFSFCEKVDTPTLLDTGPWDNR